MRGLGIKFGEGLLRSHALTARGLLGASSLPISIQQQATFI
jgi:hypothetical protein